ncbi:GP88 family protein [Urbifossiella limnaea]|uniref:Gene product 88 domain-containing protein n=1 Tax=Urbifossiella limnaea TaxID=2528023 RepID=A0A517XLT8_9BACT|nr:hypothetical protein [Urbifossiella limnaea]QDU18462.1 hypothetical protein ETAA1_03500 [Urbifossiella limnaea]
MARHPLKFGQGNGKLPPTVTTFSLAAGWSCPFASACLSRANRRTGRIRDGRHTQFRCYAASMEARRPSVRRARWHNLQALRACRTAEQMTSLLLDSLSPFARLVRVHDSGDFFSQDYFDAWLAVARARPQSTLYAYTKAAPLWVARLDQVGNGHTPGPVPNLVLTASRGGTHDDLIDEYGLRSARVVFSEQEADDLGLDVDHDDSHAMAHGPDFALLLHGTQPPGTPAARAVAALRRSGFYGYGPSTRLPLRLVAG